MWGNANGAGCETRDVADGEVRVMKSRGFPVNPRRTLFIKFFTKKPKPEWMQHETRGVREPLMNVRPEPPAIALPGETPRIK